MKQNNNTQQTDREKALEWWHKKQLFFQEELKNKYNYVVVGQKDIFKIWRSETQSPTPVSKEDGADKLDSQEFYELLYRYRFASPADQDLVIRKFEQVKQWIRDNYTPKSL